MRSSCSGVSSFQSNDVAATLPTRCGDPMLWSFFAFGEPWCSPSVWSENRRTLFDVDQMLWSFFAFGEPWCSPSVWLENRRILFDVLSVARRPVVAVSHFHGTDVAATLPTRCCDQWF